MYLAGPDHSRSHHATSIFPGCAVWREAACMTAASFHKVLSDPRTAAIGAILLQRGVRPGARVIVVGCGSGREAAALAGQLSAAVVGIDVLDGFDPAARQYATLQLGDAQALDFADASFDVVFSYHALEHIPDPHRALQEMARVLRPGGVFCVGTPNRTRLFGYIGGNSTWPEKIRWNLADWQARLKGRFRNELGAHAGYSSGELQGMLRQHFSSAESSTRQYFLNLYARHPRLIACLADSGLGHVLFPSIYFVGVR